ncbi:hypothetical protein [Curtobacterium sp. PhB136]|uniref:hypothetical protein n=1 Tax=Curtobacterium sp. PhB136 TaxID=2485181 RepID=UPI001043ED3A|nr:hypothetical protein [Curtobacterium sp. PhB136]TCK59625.1 hypothetical protein EDF27_3484 [Curtobacterium sp. PhB136]
MARTTATVTVTAPARATATATAATAGMRERGSAGTRERGSAGTRERGSATVVVVALVAVVSLVLGSVLAAAAVRTASVRAHGAADAAALAGAAAAAGLLPDEVCVAAARVARGNGAVPGACERSGAVVRVAVVARSGPFGVRAVAVAGPSSEPQVPGRPSSRGHPRHCVYGVPVGPPVIDVPVDPDARRPRADSTIDQGVTCQARRSS